MSGDGKKIIIVKKQSGGHGRHHGGSWKVAYADFVTAMMAFFMVMWIMGMDEGTKNMVQGYFQNPVGFKRGFSGGRNVLSQGTMIANPVDRGVVQIHRWEEEQLLAEMAGSIRSSLSQIDETVDADGDMEASVEFMFTGDGLRIEMMETGDGETFFAKSSAELEPALQSVLRLVAVGLSQPGLENTIVVEGHTDATQFPGDAYSNWDLSADRALAARLLLARGGLPRGRFGGVKGLGDTELKIPEDPFDPRNRRITVLLPFTTEIEITNDSTVFLGIQPVGKMSISVGLP